MNALTAGANAPLPPASRIDVAVAYNRQHADVIVVLLDGNDRADGDSGVALFSQPVCAGGAVRLDQNADRVAIDLPSLPPAIQRILIVANADTTPAIDGTGSIRVTVSADGSPVVTASFEQPPPFATVQLVEIYQRGGAWKVRSLGDGYRDGLARLLAVHGIETTGDPAPAPPAVPTPPPAPAYTHPQPGYGQPQPASIDLTKPDLPARGGVNLTKGQGVSLRKNGGALTRVTMGLGWDPATRGRSIDLDASCVMLDQSGNKVEAVSFMHLKSKDGSVVHTGDNLTGAGAGDDESIKVDLTLVPPSVFMLAFTVNSFGGQKFSEVANAYCRLLDGNGSEVVRYDLSDRKTLQGGGSPFGQHKGVVLATLERAGDIWTLTARGDLGSGRTWRGLMPVIGTYFGGDGRRKGLFGR